MDDILLITSRGVTVISFSSKDRENQSTWVLAVVISPSVQHQQLFLVSKLYFYWIKVYMMFTNCSAENPGEFCRNQDTANRFLKGLQLRRSR